MYRRVLLLLWLVYVPIAAGAVFKWVDEDGRVHYGDRPETQRAAPVQIRPGPSGPAPAAPANRAERQRRLTDSMESERLRRLESRQKAEAEKADRARRCNWARDRMRRYESAGFLYDLDSGGERRVLGDDERRRAMHRARQEVERWCG